MRSQVDGLEQAARNANDGISMIQTAEGAVGEISNILGRMKELAVQSASGTYSSTDRAALDLEFQQLLSEVDRIARNTEWNGMKILDGNGTTTATGAVAETVTLQVGSGSGQTMDVVFKSWVPEVAWESANARNDGNAETTDTILTTGANDSTTSKTAYGTAVLAYDADDDDAQDAISGGQDKYIDIKTSGAATVVIAQIDKAITAAAAERATYGAYINRLEYASDNLLNVAQNTDASRSQIEDADYAAETSELARTQIIAQASTAMLAQANQTKQSVLALLQ
jgi:flagellin